MCMYRAYLLVWLTGIYPLWHALRANRQTSLLHSVYWAMVSWAAWGLALANAGRWPSPVASTAYFVALSLTGCTGIAVLGARRPGVKAWNAVVLALLAIDLLPLAESFLTSGVVQIDIVRLTCLAGTLAVGVLNYLPTRLAPAAIALLLGSMLESAALLVSPRTSLGYRLVFDAGWIPLVLCPWLAYAAIHGRASAASEFDQLWLDFRNRFGLVWALRLRDQFNRSAANAGWPVELRWQGLRVLPGSPAPEPVGQTAMVATLRALLKRFGPEDERALAGLPRKSGAS
jgi:hypothetical protein